MSISAIKTEYISKQKTLCFSTYLKVPPYRQISIGRVDLGLRAARWELRFS